MGGTTSPKATLTSQCQTLDQEGLQCWPNYSPDLFSNPNHKKCLEQTLRASEPVLGYLLFAGEYRSTSPVLAGQFTSTGLGGDDSAVAYLGHPETVEGQRARVWQNRCQPLHRNWGAPGACAVPGRLLPPKWTRCLHTGFLSTKWASYQFIKTILATVSKRMDTVVNT